MEVKRLFNLAGTLLSTKCHNESVIDLEAWVQFFTNTISGGYLLLFYIKVKKMYNGLFRVPDIGDN